MYCKQCGEQIDDGSRFCRHCGAEQAPQTAAPATPKPPASWSSPPPGEAATTKAVNSTGRAIGIGAAALLGLVVVGSVIGSSESPTATAVEQNADMLADNMEMQADNMDAMADALTKPAGGGGSWSYSTDEDKMRGGTTYFASTTSTNTVHQNSPYDADTSMRMTVRKSPAHGTDVVLTISSGQLMCPSYEGCSGTVRFDSGPAQRISFSGTADDSSETIFVDGAKSFVGKLKKAKKVLIEKTLYQAGSPQFEFDVAGLKWDR